MRSFRERSEEAELMDNPAAAETDLRENLREIVRINQLLGGYGVVNSALAELEKDGAAFSLLDIGCGSGDTLREIHKLGKKRSWNARLMGLDLNPVMISVAKEACEGVPISFYCLDVKDEQVLALQPDYVTASLFCHHFRKLDLVMLLRRMVEISQKAVIINDLHRHSLAYFSIKTLTKIFSKSRFTKHDAPLSVARAFTRKDWEETLAAARISDYQLTWCWAFRWRLVIPKQ